MKIGIIGAMDIEVDGIKKNIENCRIEAQLAKDEMREVKRLIKEIKKK